MFQFGGAEGPRLRGIVQESGGCEADFRERRVGKTGEIDPGERGGEITCKGIQCSNCGGGHFLRNIKRTRTSKNIGEWGTEGGVWRRE